jgi:hypothetical protein
LEGSLLRSTFSILWSRQSSCLKILSFSSPTMDAVCRIMVDVYLLKEQWGQEFF